ncbi:MAG: IS4 family transposase [Firmicutes bacterium]|nr:IS4 family transposase [Bacillota bacterium]
MPRVKIDYFGDESPTIMNEFAHVAVKDRRLVKRLQEMALLLAKKPGSSLPCACGSWAKTKAAYRLLDNRKITREVILASHRESTLARVKEHEIVLIPQDTTALDFSTHRKAEGLGPYATDREARGLLMHTAMAVTPEGVPLGVLSQKIWAREEASYGKRHRRKELSVAEKESRKWLEAMDESLAGLPPGVMAVTIGDREADVYDLFLKASREGKELLIRATQDRRLEGGRLLAEMEEAPLLGECLVKVARNPASNLPPREARLLVRARPVTLLPPLKRSGEGLPPVKLYAILAREIAPPPEVKEPIEWLLLTTLKVETMGEAAEKIGWYTQRWKIERYHYVLKSGCRVEELQLETAERLKKAIALYSVVAWQITWLTYQARETPEAPCTVVFDEKAWQTLYCLINNTAKPPKKPPTLKQVVFMLARLGGFLGRKGDGDPGVKVLWRGLRRLHDALEVLKTLQPLLFDLDVGNV